MAHDFAAGLGDVTRRAPIAQFFGDAVDFVDAADVQEVLFGRVIWIG